MSGEVTFTFNETDFSTLVSNVKVNKDIGNERSIESFKRQKLGVNVTSVYTAHKEIEVEFSLNSKGVEVLEFIDIMHDTTGSAYRPTGDESLDKLREVVASLFNTDHNGAKLIFSTEPDRYYQALVVGKVDLSTITTWYGTAKVTFYVPDGTAHSITYKRVEDYEDYVDKMIFNISNEGSVETYPIITIDHELDENGYIAIVNENGAFEAGQKTEADMAKYKRSERLLDFYGKKGELVTKAIETGIKNDPILNIDNSPMTMNLHINKAWGTKHISL